MHCGFVKESSDHQVESTNELEKPSTNSIQLSARLTSSDAHGSQTVESLSQSMVGNR